MRKFFRPSWRSKPDWPTCRRSCAKCRELSREVDTVISIGVSTRCDGAGEEPLREILEREGYPTYRGKTNLGLGRVTMQSAKNAK